MESIPEDHSFDYEYPNGPYLRGIKCATPSQSHYIQVLYDAVVVEVFYYLFLVIGFSPVSV